MENENLRKWGIACTVIAWIVISICTIAGIVVAVDSVEGFGLFMFGGIVVGVIIGWPFFIASAALKGMANLTKEITEINNKLPKGNE